MRTFPVHAARTSRPRSSRSQDAGRSWGSLRVLASYLALFTLVLVPRGALSTRGLPGGFDFYDAQLIVWILGWVAHALATDPARLFDANINYPAPAQLTGSDHFFSTQLAFAPLLALTGNPVLATNAVVYLSYPLAALAMERLLRALGSAGSVAWVGGLIFALGPLRVPMNTHVLQYPNLYLPLVALALVRLRERPEPWQAGVLALAFGTGIFASYYLAMLLGCTAVTWGLVEYARREPERSRFLVLAAGVGLATTATLAVCVWPYLARSELHPALFGRRVPWELVALAGRIFLHFEPYRVAWLVGAAVGAVALVARVPAARRAAVPGLLLTLVGFGLAFAVPAALAWASPGRLVPYLQRFVVVGGFGEALLLAAALETLRRRVPPRAGTVAVLLSGALLAWPALTRLPRFTMLDVTALGPSSPVYDRLAEIARRDGAGALLELPLSGRVREAGRGGLLEPDAMVGSTRHWLPLIHGYTGWQPAHRRLLVDLIVALPDEGALQDLVDMTHLRWILVRPADFWSQPGDHATLVAGLAHSPTLGAPAALDGWLLFPVRRNPSHPEWFAAIAGGWRPGTTALGTPLSPLAPADAVGSVTAVAPPAAVSAGAPFTPTVTARNAGSVTWPAAEASVPPLALSFLPPPGPPGPGTVVLAARWRKAGSATWGSPQHVRLRRDLPAGEALTQPLPLVSPGAPGDYELEVRPEQVAGTAFDAPGTVPLRLAVPIP